MEQTDFITKKGSMALNPAGRQCVLPEEALGDFSPGFLDEKHCREWILNKLHPEGPKCPHCKIALGTKQADRFSRNERIECPGCGKWFNSLFGTLFYKIRFSFSEIFLLMVLLGTNQPNKFIAEKLNVDRETIRIWRKKFAGDRKTSRNFR